MGATGWYVLAAVCALIGAINAVQVVILNDPDTRPYRVALSAALFLAAVWTYRRGAVQRDWPAEPPPSYDEDQYAEAETWLPRKVARPDEMLHPYGMGPDLAAILMNSLRWLGDKDLGGRQRSDADRERFLRIAQACEDYLAIAGGAPASAFILDPAAPSGFRPANEDAGRLLRDALERMKELFEPEVFEHLWI